ncbi:MAG: J domain-containing protein [Bacteroidota bacterium]
MNFVDYYKILGLNKTATSKDIKNAYRKLARKFHPDLNPNNKGAVKNFQQINEANEVLSDPVKRKKYDQYGKDWQHAEEFEKARQYQNQSSTSHGAAYSGSQSEGDFSDFFESMFGKTTGPGWNRQVKYKGEDYTTELHLDLVEAFKTHQRTFNVNGKNIRITIPSGIENGQIIKIHGHGGKGKNNGPDGDLFITFSIANHPKIKRRGNNLYTDVNLEFYTAILGGKITVDTLNGKVKINVKPETQNGSMIKLKGKGFPIYKKEGFFGDFFVTYLVLIPTNLNEKQKELFRELAEI